MSLEIKYILNGAGWAKCELRDGNTSCIITASYLSDALRSMVLSATAVISYFSKVTFSFDEEPGEYRWVISSVELNKIELSILSFNELWGNQPDSEGECIFKTQCAPLVFAQAVLDSANDVLRTYEIKGYNEKWSRHEFPLAQLQELKRLVLKANA